MESQKIPFLAVVCSHTLGCMGDTNFRFYDLRKIYLHIIDGFLLHHKDKKIDTITRFANSEL